MLRHKKPGDTLYIVSRFKEVPPVTVKIDSVGYSFIHTVNGEVYRRSNGAPRLHRKSTRDATIDSRAWASKDVYEEHLAEQLAHVVNVTTLKRRISEIHHTAITPEQIQAIKNILAS